MWGWVFRTAVAIQTTLLHTPKLCQEHWLVHSAFMWQGITQTAVHPACGWRERTRSCRHAPSQSSHAEGPGLHFGPLYKGKIQFLGAAARWPGHHSQIPTFWYHHFVVKISTEALGKMPSHQCHAFLYRDNTSVAFLPWYSASNNNDHSNKLSQWIKVSVLHSERDDFFFPWSIF